MAANSNGSFILKDCAMASLATGRRARNLRELCDHLRQVDAESIYYHFWGTLLRPRLEDPEYVNDFASWVRHALHDDALAERLAVIDPAGFDDMEDLRETLIDTIEDELDRNDTSTWARRLDQFHFIQGHIVVFDTGKRIRDPVELRTILPDLSLGNIFYHFVDARRRTPQRVDDFRVWLAGFNHRYASLVEQLAGLDPFFHGLAGLRDGLVAAFRRHLDGGEA